MLLRATTFPTTLSENIKMFFFRKALAFYSLHSPQLNVTMHAFQRYEFIEGISVHPNVDNKRRENAKAKIGNQIKYLISASLSRCPLC